MTVSRRPPPASRTLYFVRHGETDWNAERRLQGQQDVPLNARGRCQADEAGRLLRALVADPAQLDYVASPLTRACETAARMRRAAGLPAAGFRLDERLKEVSFGAWEGLRWTDIRKRFPRAYAERETDRWAFVPEAGESYAMLAQRTAEALADLARDTVVVAHGGVARALLTIACGLAEAFAPTVPIWQGRILVIRDGHFTWTRDAGAHAAP